jgi:transcriptional regulator with XRE-family HTH domain
MSSAALPPVHRTIGHVIHALRRERGLRQAELAALTGLKQPNLSRIENGLVVPRQSTLEKLGLALGMNVRELLSPERARQVEAQWAAVMTPRNAGQLFAGQLVAVPLYASEGLEFDGHGRPAGKATLSLQLTALHGRPFALTMPDSTMQARSASDGFRAGEVLVFSDQPPVRSGDYAWIVSARFRGLRRVLFEHRGEQLRLVALQHAHPQLTVGRGEVRGIFRLVLRLQEF